MGTTIAGDLTFNARRYPQVTKMVTIVPTLEIPFLLWNELAAPLNPRQRLFEIPNQVVHVLNPH
jgi:hypothetical protein